MKFVLEDLPSNIFITELVDVIGRRCILKMRYAKEYWLIFFFFFTISEYRLIYRRKFEGRILSMIHGTCMEKQQFEEKEIGERVRVLALNGCSSKE